ncbi:MAG: hypothetical protein ACREJD_15465 [Phycisphaerales bacterium]
MPPTDDPDRSANIPDLETAPPSREFLAIATFDFAWRNRLCAIDVDEIHVLLVTTSDTPPNVVARICERLTRECQVIEVSDEEICRLITRAYEQPRPK